MNQLISSDNLTMSSREISELVGTRHDGVMRTIESLNMKGLLESPQFVETQNQQNKQFYTMANLGKTDCLVLIARLSPEFMKAIVDRWQELENKQKQPALPDFNNPVESARAWADAKESEQKALELIKQQAPAVKFVDNYTQAETGSKGFRQVAKLLKANERVFREFLVDKVIMYKSKSGWMAYQRHVDVNRFEVITGEKNSHIYNEVLFTGKGINWIAGLWAIELIALGEKK